MKILIAPDSFKGSLSAVEAAEAICNGAKKVFPHAKLIKMPLSDGGEGLVQTMVSATGGEIIEQTVTGPLGKPVDAFWGILGDKKTAVIEMASASGLMLVPEINRNPLFTTTYGTGELIKGALNKGCRKIIIGLGGSATNDGGSGMAQALGAKLLDEHNRAIGFGGQALLSLDRIDITEFDIRIQSVDVLVACDVDNTLTGYNGAAEVFGPQKGANAIMVKELDRALAHYAKIIARDLGFYVDNIPGSGAAGGLGAGVLAFLSGKLTAGIDLVIDTLDMENHLQDCDLVITGEGRLDTQSLNGKVPIGLAKRAKKYGIPVIVVAGSVSKELNDLSNYGITAYFSIINEPISLKQTMLNGRVLLEKEVVQILNLYSSTAAIG